jgi:rhamnosyltransferase
MLLVIPTFNAGSNWPRVIDSIVSQNLKPLRVYVVDSGSKDQTLPLSISAGFEYEVIRSKDFDHGGTRTFALNKVEDEDEFIIYMTQDAELENRESLQNLIKPFIDPQVALVYGRQLPNLNATLLASQVRNFNYPDVSSIKTYSDRYRLGIKTAFCSNSFAAYRLSALREVGGFPTKTIMGEDMLVAAMLLKKGYAVFYEANACVYHSHNYSLKEEFQRYFDTGVFHYESRDLLKDFGGVTGEGFKLLRAQLGLMVKQRGLEKFLIVFEVISRNILKYLAYQLGRKHVYLPVFLKSRLSMFKGYWSTS